MLDKMNAWLDSPVSSRVARVVVRRPLATMFLFLSALIACNIFPGWFRAVQADCREAARFEAVLQGNMVKATPRGAEPTGEIWVRESWMPFLTRIKILVHPTKEFRVFKNDREALAILHPMIDKPIFLQSMTRLSSRPGILRAIEHFEPDGLVTGQKPEELLAIESRDTQSGDLLEDMTLMIPLDHVGAIYAYRDKQ